MSSPSFNPAKIIIDFKGQLYLSVLATWNGEKNIEAPSWHNGKALSISDLPWETQLRN